MPNATYQVPRSSACWFWKRRFLKGFNIYGRGGHLGHVTRTIWTHFHSPILSSLHMKFEYMIQWFQRRRCLKMLTDRRTTEAGVIGILLAHPWAFCILADFLANQFTFQQTALSLNSESQWKTNCRLSRYISFNKVGLLAQNEVYGWHLRWRRQRRQVTLMP